ncbi:MAG: N-6 DNA methylase, partial [Acidobacteria bacterium]|nr:N-6 DNA methylase [Acidobacteriota bacterium]MCA1651303.1 N-6 DNA methylase [Acidobacteriota bacterium]
MVGLSGTLLSQDALARTLPASLEDLFDAVGSAGARRRIAAWHSRVLLELGPASGPRAVFDRLAAPLARQLGFTVVPTGIHARGTFLHAALEVPSGPAASLLVTGWGHDAASVWREAVRAGIGLGLRWCLCVTGPSLRVFDTQRTYSRRLVAFDLAATFADEASFTVLWGTLRSGAFGADRPDRATALEHAIALSERHRTDVGTSLRDGVCKALTYLVSAFIAAARRAPRVDAQHMDEPLIVVYRVLFLLFAEARGLVPVWHPTFRDGYSMEALRERAAIAPTPGGLWEGLQAITRLAHRGCQAGTLKVPPFNGRLFSPAHAPLADSVRLGDSAVREALLALTTRAGRAGPERIAYGDLGVEQLGSVYEHVLDLDLVKRGTRHGPVTLVRTQRRKATGSFYTPRALTECVVRRALAPLVIGASPEQVLSLRILDPAMGSGAFLVAACRYLAHAYELALIEELGLSPSDITDGERAGFRRAIAQRCLYGVDINPMAVQLGRLSLWLATLATDRPLTFLDHHLRDGNSLVGASLADVAGSRPGGRTRSGTLSLFPSDAFDAAIGGAVGVRVSIARDPGDTLDQVRSKERMLGQLAATDSPITAWKDMADLWCAAWFGSPLQRSFDVVAHTVRSGAAKLPSHVSAPLLASARAIAGRERFFHWTFEFPELFYDDEGRTLASPGFDAVIGNPPWEMLRDDGAQPLGADNGRIAVSRLADFVRGSGVYRLQGHGHTNLYQLFLERGLSLLRPGGRLGIVLPSGFGTDQGCAALRHHLLERTEIDTYISVENRDGLFPIHRGLKFLLICAASGLRTSSLTCRFGVRSPDVLDQVPDTGPDPLAVTLERGLLERLGGPQLPIPELRTREDIDVAATIAFGV